MGFEIVAIAGSHRGRRWPVGETPLTLGRSRECDVTLVDPLASRLHCRIVKRNNEIWLEDLGSKNPAFVNGNPVASGTLHPGDEITLGRERFLLAIGARRAEEMLTAKADEPTTASVDLNHKRLPRRYASAEASRTIHDLAEIHRLFDRMGAAESLDTLATDTAGHLREKYGARRIWIALVRAERLSFLRIAGEPVDPREGAPLETLQQALRERQPVMAAAPSGSDWVFAVPVGMEKVQFAVVGMLTPAGSAPAEDVLAFLGLLARYVAPFFPAVEAMTRLQEENERLRALYGESDIMVGESAAMQRAKEQLRSAAATDLNVIITGETGTGKELAAQMLHRLSLRHNGPLIVVNCAAIPRELMESELFGHRKGAFTGATENRSGLLERAHGGTLFLDEVGDLSLDCQARILRAVESGCFRRVGEHKEIYIDLRVVAATNVNIPEAVKLGKFRQDLYYRLQGFSITLPPLRDRSSDIPLLAHYFLELGRQGAPHGVKRISEEAMQYLQSRPWPGNVRELRNCIARAVAVAQTDTLTVDDVWDAVRDAQARPQLAPLVSLADAEREHVQRVLSCYEGDMRRAAKALGIGVSTLYKKVRLYNLVQE